MYTPTIDDEITGLVRYLDQQLDALRAAALGLSEEQIRARPCRSALSIGGLLKHATYCMRGAVDRLASGTTPVLDEAAYAVYGASFALADGETGAGALAEFDQVRVAYLAAVAALDPAAPTTEPPAPWLGIFDERPANARYFVVHQIEEMARHAGHADIIREEIDGMSVSAIVLSEEGAPASEVFDPYVATAGTVGAR